MAGDDDDGEQVIVEETAPSDARVIGLLRTHDAAISIGLSATRFLWISRRLGVLPATRKAKNAEGHTRTACMWSATQIRTVDKSIGAAATADERTFDGRGHGAHDARAAVTRAQTQGSPDVLKVSLVEGGDTE